MADQPHPASQSMQLFNSISGALDFKVDYIDKKGVGERFSTDRFVQCQEYNIIWLFNGKGRYQVDFQSYYLENDVMIFLTPGQYFYVENGDFEIIKYSFQQQFFCVKEYNPQTLCNGVLFNHVYAVASIKIGEQENELFSKINKKIWAAFSDYFLANKNTIKKLLAEFLSAAVQIWLVQSPFNPNITEEETDLLFAFRRALEENFMNKKKMPEYATLVGVSEKKIQRLVKNRINKKLSELIAHRQLVEAKRQLYFTGKSNKEIAYYIGFDDPSYFNRFFKKNTGLTPEQFREKHDIFYLDNILSELKLLIDNYFKKEHSVSFYAEKMCLTSRTLSNMVKKASDKTVSDFIKLRLALEAKRMLLFSEKTVKEIAWELGFDEASHFSHFFKSATGMSPETYRIHRISKGEVDDSVLEKQLRLQNWDKSN